MKKTAFILFCFVLLVMNAFPFGVDVNEIKVNTTVKFINYEGKLKTVTVEEILGIGSELSASLSKNKTEGRAGKGYVIIHAFDANEKTKFDADIFSMTRSADVKHVDTLRLIIAGYLRKQYGYTLKDAETLAVFLSYYNAVYRLNVTYFGTKYKQVVMNNITDKDAGLAVDYKEWPGATKLLIPLSEGAKKSDLSSLDTSELSNKDVIDTMKKEDDKKIDERKDLVDLKEKEVKQDKKELEKDKDKVAEDKKKLEDEKKKLEDEKKKLEDEKKKIDTITDKTEKDKITEDLKKKEEELKKKEDTLKKKEDTVVKKDEEIKKKEDTVTKKEEEIKKDKEDIKKDEKITEIKKDPDKYATELSKKEEDLKKREDLLKKQETDKSVYAGKLYYLKVLEYLAGGHYNNEMYLINANSGEVMLQAPHSSISGRKFDICPEGVVVITHKGSTEPNSYLSLLDLDTLEIKKTSVDAVFHRSFVEIKENEIYVIAHVDTNYNLAKYNFKMERLSVSKETVDPDSFISIYGDKVYVNSSDKRILVLNKKTLELEGAIKP